MKDPQQGSRRRRKKKKHHKLRTNCTGMNNRRAVMENGVTSWYENTGSTVLPNPLHNFMSGLSTDEHSPGCIFPLTMTTFLLPNKPLFQYLYYHWLLPCNNIMSKKMNVRQFAQKLTDEPKEAQYLNKWWAKKLTRSSCRDRDKSNAKLHTIISKFYNSIFVLYSLSYYDLTMILYVILYGISMPSKSSRTRKCFICALYVTCMRWQEFKKNSQVHIIRTSIFNVRSASTLIIHWRIIYWHLTAMHEDL